MALTADERLAFLTALEKQIKDPIADAKAEARAGLLDSFRESGIEKRAIMIDGDKVGTVSVTWSKEKPVIDPDKRDEALAWLRENGLTEEVPVKGWEKAFARAGAETVALQDGTPTGEIVDFIDWEPATVKTASVRGCEPDQVFSDLRSKLGDGGIERLLLEDGD